MSIQLNLSNMMTEHSLKASFHFLFLLSWFLLSCPCTTTIAASYEAATGTNKCIDKERAALLELKGDIEIDRCGLLTSWGNKVESTDCCGWEGVLCSHDTGNVIMLDLHGALNTGEPCLEGKISPSILKLKHLRYLDLSYNDFVGQPIPSFIGSLTELQHLNLSNAGFCGKVPHQLGNLSTLQSLHLGCISQSRNCQYVEDLEWLSHLTSLRYINFSFIDLSRATNWVQVINYLPSLTFLRMNTCSLPPALPITPSPRVNSSYLRVLDLGNNNLSSSVYQWLFNSTSFNNDLIEMIILCQNQLEGPIPASLGNFHGLRYLDFSANRIGCPIPDTIGNLEHLSYLALSENQLQGCTLPTSFGKLRSLQSLLLAENDQIEELNETISESLGHFSELQRVSMSSNSVKLILSDKHFEKLSQLRHLDLSNNSLLVLNFSLNWVPPFQLYTIKLRSCLLGPHFPKWLQTQRSISYLDISNAGISDSIPSSFWNSLTSKLSYLNMSNNKIPGTLPNLSVTFDSLNPPDIDLSSNSFEGTIPSFLGNASTLSLSYNMFTNPIPLLCPESRVVLFDLDLSNNLLSGELPADCWINADQLSFLNLESNNFSGELPTSLGGLRELRSFRLCDNFFSGKLPTSLWNCTSLVILDIGDNRFSGDIPSEIGGVLQHLVVLNLRKNKFGGGIPLSLCRLSGLQIVDLSGNGITGSIPNCIYNFSGMINKTVFLPSSPMRSRNAFGAWVKWKRVQRKFEKLLGHVKSIDFSNNELEGEIPTEISCLEGLVSIDLSRNRLSGNIRPEIGQLRYLEFLDLSNNHLRGEIPVSLAILSFLGMLDLSYNNLSGKIPEGTQLQSFDASAYIGNPELCGAPLPMKCRRDNEEPISNSNNGENIAQQNMDNDDGIFPGLYISVVLGCVIGFWGVCGSLALKSSWRHAYFQFVDHIIHSIQRRH